MINIAKKIVVGLHAVTQVGKLPTSIICPVGKTATEVRKAERMAEYCKTVTEYDNIPLPGFTLTKSGRLSWGSSETIWIVIDPRGFTSAITSSNLEKILHCTGITEGLIQDKCVWAREDSSVAMILIPISSAEYGAAVENTVALENKVSRRDVALGDTVKLQNGVEGKYLGVVNLYEGSELSYHTPTLKPRSILKKQIIQVTPTSYFFNTDLKILSVSKKIDTPMTKTEVCKYLNASVIAGHMFSYHIYTAKTPPTTPVYDIRHVSSSAVKSEDIVCSVEQVSFAEAEQLFELGKRTRDFTVLLLGDADGKQYIVNWPNRYEINKIATCTVNTFGVIPVVSENGSIELHPSIYRKTKPFSGCRHAFPVDVHALSDFVTYHKVVKHIKTDSYV